MRPDLFNAVVGSVVPVRHFKLYLCIPLQVLIALGQPPVPSVS